MLNIWTQSSPWCDKLDGTAGIPVALPKHALTRGLIVPENVFADGKGESTTWPDWMLTISHPSRTPVNRFEADILRVFHPPHQRTLSGGPLPAQIQLNQPR